MSNSNMETPPSSPPNAFKKSSSSSPSMMDTSPSPADTEAVPPPITALDTKQAVHPGRGHIRVATPSTPIPVEEAFAASAASQVQKSNTGRGHIRVATPSTPIHVEEAFAASAASQSENVPQLAFSTPGRSSSGSGSAQLHPMISSTGHHLMSELTPVISNSGTYVDTHITSNHANNPGMPGLTRGEGGRMAGAQASSGGLKQRKSRMPLPRAGLPPAKRSDIEVPSDVVTPLGLPSAAGEEGVASILRMASSNASSDSSLRGSDQLKISPSTPLSVPSATGSEENDGLGALLGERLSMPSYELEDSSIDTSNGSSSNGRARQSNVNEAFGGAPSQGAARSIFKEKEKVTLAPIELKPDRKFFSFQGTSQYTQQHRLETIASPSRIKGVPPSPSSGMEAQQYQPTLRSQHGVHQMAQKQDLDAIFKAPRSSGAPNVVSPIKSPPAMSGGSPMFVEGQQPSLQQLRSTNMDDQEGDGTDQNHHLLSRPIPMDDRQLSQFSIPSIRLANHVNQSSMPTTDSMADFSAYTYDDDGASLDESYYSFLADDDDTASLSSQGSVDASTRRRRWSNFRRMSSSASAIAEAADSAADGSNAVNDRLPQTILRPAVGTSDVPTSSVPQVEESNSFVERMQGISIENAESNMALPPPLPRRVHTFDLESPPIDINVPVQDTMDDDPVDYNNNDARRSSRRRRQRGSRRRRREGAAVEWLQELQNQSKLGGGESSGGNQVLITEAASSKFLIGDHIRRDSENDPGTSLMGIGVSKGQLHPYPTSSPSEDVVTKALGMPHPLCRSSTIEAGPFVNRARGGMGGFGSMSNDVGAVGVLALTSSGSGDA